MLTKRENKQTFELFYMLILTTNFGLRIISMMKRASMTLSIMLRTPLRPSELCWLAQTCRSHHDEVSRKIKKKQGRIIYLRIHRKQITHPYEMEMQDTKRN